MSRKKKCHLHTKVSRALLELRITFLNENKRYDYHKKIPTFSIAEFFCVLCELVSVFMVDFQPLSNRLNANIARNRGR